MFSIKFPAPNRGHESVWACLPAGPLERHWYGGGPGGIIGEGVLSNKDLQKGEKRLPWKGHNSGKPLLVTRLDASPLGKVAQIIFRILLGD